MRRIAKQVREGGKMGIEVGGTLFFHNGLFLRLQLNRNRLEERSPQSNRFLLHLKEGLVCVTS